MRQFTEDFPDLDKHWFENSNYLVCLSAPDLKSLTAIRDGALALGLAVSSFYEPDLNNELTAIAVAPSDAARKLLSRLPLALKKAIEHGRRTDTVPEMASPFPSDVP